jgi:hypothetical protein
MRISALLEKCKAKFGEINEDGQLAGGALPAAAPTTPAKPKRKRAPNSAGKAATKKAKVEEDSVEDEAAKTAAAIGYVEASSVEPEA